MTALDRIRNSVPWEARLAQLAEECAELAQAALKLRRTMPEVHNPTPVDCEEAFLHLREETADVLLMMHLAVDCFGFWAPEADIQATFRAKAERWLARIGDGERTDAVD